MLIIYYVFYDQIWKYAVAGPDEREILKSRHPLAFPTLECPCKRKRELNLIGCHECKIICVSSRMKKNFYIDLR